MEQSEATKKVMLASFLTFIVSVALYGLLFSLILEQKSAADASAEKAASQSAQKTQLDSLAARAAETADLRAKLGAYFIQPNGVVPFLNTIQSLGTENNLEVKVSAVAIGAAATSSDIVEEVRVSVRTAGSWSDTYRFLTLLDTAPMPLFIDSADIEKLAANTELSAPKKTRGAAEWQGSFALRALKLK